MLILTRKTGESIMIGDNIKLIVLNIQGNMVRFGVAAPSSTEIYREEIYIEVQKEKARKSERIKKDDIEKE